MSPDVISRVITSLNSLTNFNRLKFTPAALKGYKRRQVLGAKYPGIIKSTYDSVEGIVVSGFSSEDLDLLDLYEGEHYERNTVQVETVVKRGSTLLGTPDQPSESLIVETYVWKYGLKGLSHLDWSFEAFVNDALEKWMTSEEEFKEVDMYHIQEK